MKSFIAEIHLIGINPYVSVPGEVLVYIFGKAGKDQGPIPIAGTVNGTPYRQTLVKFQGQWRLYINTAMLKNSPKRIGEIIELTIDFDDQDRTILPHPGLTEALEINVEARTVFEGLSPSRRHEIIRYISSLKTEASVERNIRKVIDHLLGKARFVGRANTGTNRINENIDPQT